MPSNMVKGVLHGSGVGEEWTVGVWIQNCLIDDEQQAHDVAGQWRGFLKDGSKHPNFVVNSHALISADQHWDTLSVYFYPDPTQDATYIAHVPWDVDMNGTSNMTLPLQVAVCCTIETGLSGPSRRGRMYLPATGAPNLGTGHRYSSAFCSLAAETCVDIGSGLEEACQDIADATADWVVYSPKLGDAKTVTGVSVDNRPDIQRRRAGKQLSTITAHQIVNPSTAGGA